MATDLDRIAAKARKEKNLRFSSLAHPVNEARIWRHLRKINKQTSKGVDNESRQAAEKSFNEWIGPLLGAIPRQGYRAPAVRRVYIPKAGKQALRPIGIPTIRDRALQSSVAEVLSAIYEQDFLPLSFGSRPGLSAHHALATLTQRLSTGRMHWVLEADIKNFYGSLDHGWLLQFLSHRVGDPRIGNLVYRWLKAGVMEEGQYQPSKEGTPQGGSISALLSNVYLHYVLDLWYQKRMQGKLRGESQLVRYADDFVVCFTNRADAITFQAALDARLNQFGLRLETTKTRLVAFSNRAAREQHGTKGKAEVFDFLGFTVYGKRDRRGRQNVGVRTKKTAVQRVLGKVRQLLRELQHAPIRVQASKLVTTLRGHFTYFGFAGNSRSLSRVKREAERYWRVTLSKRSRKGHISWEKFRQLLRIHRLPPVRLTVPYHRLRDYAVP